MAEIDFVAKETGVQPVTGLELEGAVVQDDGSGVVRVGMADATVVSQAVAEAGSDVSPRHWSSLRIRQAIAAAVSGALTYQGGYDASTNTPDLDTAPSGVFAGDVYTVTVAGVFFTANVEVGDMIIAEIDSAAVEADWTIVNKNLDAASVKTLYESNADTNGLTDAQVALIANLVGAVPDFTSVGLNETTTPTPVANVGRIYTKVDGLLYFQNGSGTETAVGAGTSLFVDNAFTIEGNVDGTKEMMFDVDTNVPASTVVTIKAPAADMDLSLVYLSGGTDVAIADGGTGASTAQAAIDALTAVAGATNEYVLTKDTATGNAVWKAAAGGGGSGGVGSEPITEFKTVDWRLVVVTSPATAEIQNLYLYTDDGHTNVVDAYGVAVTSDASGGSGFGSILDPLNSLWFYHSVTTHFEITLSDAVQVKSWALEAKASATIMPTAFDLEYSLDGGTTWIAYASESGLSWTGGEKKDFTITFNDYPASPIDGQLLNDETNGIALRYDAASTEWKKVAPAIPACCLHTDYYSSRLFRFIARLPASTGEIEWMKFFEDEAMTSEIDMSTATITCDHSGGSLDQLFNAAQYTWWSGNATATIWTIAIDPAEAPAAFKMAARASATNMVKDFLLETSVDGGMTWTTLLHEYDLTWTGAEQKSWTIKKFATPATPINGMTVWDLNRMRPFVYDESDDWWYDVDENIIYELGDTTAAESIDYDISKYQTFTLAVADTTLDPSVWGGRINAECRMRVHLIQDATGSRTVTWDASVLWPAGTAPTLSTAAGAIDIFELTSIDGGTTWFARTLGLGFA